MSRVLAAYADAAEAAGAWQRVESSNLYAVWYQPDFQRLFVWFGGNAKAPILTRYAYDDIPPDVYERLLAAPSKGKFLAEKIKAGGYGYTKL